MSAAAALECVGLTKRYGRRTALEECTLGLPQGHVTGLVGPNGAGKTTLLQLAVGLLRPSGGTISVLGGRPGSGPEQLARVGFVAQDAPVYAGLSVRDHLTLGAKLNPRWDKGFAAEQVARHGLDPRQKAGRLSGGQRAKLALTLAVAKRPDLLVLDEPVASLDPLARRDFLAGLMEYAAGEGASVILSSHLVGDLERICDRMVVLTGARLRIEGDTADLIASHHRLTGPRQGPGAVPPGCDVVHESHTDRQSTYVVRCSVPLEDPAWTVSRLDLEDLVLADLDVPPPPAAAQLAEVRR